MQAIANVPMPRPAPRRSRAYASTPSSVAYASTAGAPASSGVIDGLLAAPSRAASSMARVFGFGRDDEKPTSKITPTHRPQPARAAQKPQPDRSKSAEKPVEPQVAEKTAPAKTTATTRPEPQPAAAANLMTGSQPVLQTGGFENRWPSTFR